MRAPSALIFAALIAATAAAVTTAAARPASTAARLIGTLVEPNMPGATC